MTRMIHECRKCGRRVELYKGPGYHCRGTVYLDDGTPVIGECGGLMRVVWDE